MPDTVRHIITGLVIGGVVLLLTLRLWWWQLARRRREYFQLDGEKVEKRRK
ncbi:MAG TPA: hypothetical protein VM537_32850 [Anaerolineae bacterium]|nr:hypothetical protein [Anaerolineae bacterium]